MMGLKRRVWSEDDIRYLEFSYSNAPFDEMIKRLGRSKPAIRGKAKLLGLTRQWADYEVDFLLKHYKKADIYYIADKLDRDVISVRNKIAYMRLSKGW